jgi:hypothetical protein
MRPADHFFSQIERFEARNSAGQNKDTERLRRDFTALIGPVTGARAAEDFFAGMLARIRPGQFARLGAAAAFFLREFDDETMSLEDEDWDDIRETLTEVSAEINIDTLTALMQELLSRGKL